LDATTLRAVNQIIDGESVRPCDKCWPDKELTNQQEAGAMGTGVSTKDPRLARCSASGRLTTKVNKQWSAPITAQVVQLGGVPITKEEIRKQVLADEDDEDEDDEDEAGPSKKPKGGQQKISFPKVAKAVTHPVGTGTLGLQLVMLFMVGLAKKIGKEDVDRRGS
jgi:hypothetical protein